MLFLLDHLHRYFYHNGEEEHRWRSEATHKDQ
jgi:hypothetical protein